MYVQFLRVLNSDKFPLIPSNGGHSFVPLYKCTEGGNFPTLQQGQTVQCSIFETDKQTIKQIDKQTDKQ